MISKVISDIMRNFPNIVKLIIVKLLGFVFIHLLKLILNCQNEYLLLNVVIYFVVDVLKILVIDLNCVNRKPVMLTVVLLRYQY